MDWQQQFQAIQALGGDPSLRMRHPGNWYVAQSHVEVKRPSSTVALTGAR